MKYLTEEWYRLYRLSGFGGRFFHTCKHAAQYDEKLFRKLYRKAEKQWGVAMRSALVGEDDETHKKALARIEHFIEIAKNDKDRAKLEKFRKDFIALHEALKEKSKKYAAIDDESVRKTFAGRCAENMKILKTLPSELLDKVADMRMLAIGYATKENKKAIKSYVFKQGMIADDMWGKALDMVEEAERYMSHPSELNEYPSAVMVGIRKGKKSVVLKFDDIPDIRVINGKIIKKEKPIYRWGNEPLSRMSLMVGKELEYINGKYRLSLFMEDIGRYESVTTWELIIEGDDIITKKITKAGENNFCFSLAFLF